MQPTRSHRSRLEKAPLLNIVAPRQKAGVYGGMLLRPVQQAVAAVFMVAVAGFFFYGSPPYGAIWRSIIAGCAVLGVVVAIVEHFMKKAAPGPRE